MFKYRNKMCTPGQTVSSVSQDRVFKEKASFALETWGWMGVPTQCWQHTGSMAGTAGRALCCPLGSFHGMPPADLFPCLFLLEEVRVFCLTILKLKRKHTSLWIIKIRDKTHNEFSVCIGSRLGKSLCPCSPVIRSQVPLLKHSYCLCFGSFGKTY